MNVYKKLQQARILLAKTDMKKSGHNKFANYKYFELGDFLKPIQSIFNELGLCGAVSFDKEFAQLSIFNVDATDEVIHFFSPIGSAALKGCHEVQNIGAVQTYQRRYLYVNALEIVEHDAIDNQPQEEQKEEQKETRLSAGAMAATMLEVKISAEEQSACKEIAKFIRDMYNDDCLSEAHDEFYAIENNDIKIAVWNELKSDSKIRSAIKKHHEELANQ